MSHGGCYEKHYLGALAHGLRCQSYSYSCLENKLPPLVCETMNFNLQNVCATAKRKAFD